jgi:hypothetical protein
MVDFAVLIFTVRLGTDSRSVDGLEWRGFSSPVRRRRRFRGDFGVEAAS